MVVFHGIAFGRRIPQDGFCRSCRRSIRGRIVVLVDGGSWNQGHVGVKRNDTTLLASMVMDAASTTAASALQGGR